MFSSAGGIGMVGTKIIQGENIITMRNILINTFA